MALRVPLKTTAQIAIANEISPETLINCFPTLRQNQSQTEMGIVGSHGWSTFNTVHAGSQVRACVANEDGTTSYVVVDGVFYTVTSGGAVTGYGSLNTTTGPVSLQVGVNYVMIADGTNGYTFNIGTPASISTISDPQFPTSVYNLAYIDGYFVAIGVISGSNVIAFSDLDNPNSWQTILQIALEARADTPIAAYNVNRDLYILGTTTAEIYNNIPGKTGFPLTRVAVREYGIAAGKSVAACKGILYWLARTEQSTAVLVSSSPSCQISIVPNEDMNRLFQTYATVSDAIGFCYSDMGQDFYQITFPTQNVTWTYCISTGHFYQNILASGDRSLANCYMFLGGKHIIGDRSSGKLYQMSLSTYTEAAGSAIPRTVIPPTFYANDAIIFPCRVKLQCDSSTYSTSRTFTMASSTDGGHNYNTGLTWSVTQYSDYMLFSRFTAGRQITLKLTANFADKFAIVNMQIYYYTSADGGAHG